MNAATRSHKEKIMSDVRSLRVIAREIESDWHPVHPTAAPYVDAMRDLEKVTDNYGADTGSYIVAYFLENARTWRGDTARRIKAELRGMLAT